MTSLAPGEALPPLFRYAPAGIRRTTSERDRVAEWLLYSQIIGATFLQKFAIPIGGNSQLYVGLFVVLGATLAGIATRRLQIHKLRLALFLVMAGGMAVTQLLGEYGFLGLSLPLLLVTHWPYIFHLTQEQSSKTRRGAELECFQKIMSIFAVLGILQYAIQFYIGWRYAFYLDSEFPQQFIFQGFHGLNPLSYGSHVYKSNGVFLLEPAIFCQMLALGIVIEMVYFRSLKRMFLFLAAAFFTFSGTGLIVIGILVPVLLLQRRQYALLAVLLMLGATAGLWAPTLGFGSLVDRVGEFSNKETSGYARFISMFRIIYDYVLPRGNTLLFGMGAGSVKSVAGQVSYAIHDPSWGKVVFEYGLVGALTYFPLMIHVFLTSPRSWYVKAALAIQFLFLGEYVLSPTVHGLILGLMAWPVADRPFKTSG